MLLPTTTMAAVRCPACGKMEIQELSLFEFVSSKTVERKCECGEILLSIYSKDRKNFRLQYQCVMCDSLHVNNMRRHDMWPVFPGRGLEIYCDDTVFGIGYIGSGDWIKEKIEDEPDNLAELAEHMGFTKYFNNSEVMYEILEHIYHIAEEGGLYCNCGSYNVDIEVFPDHLEILCEECSSRGKIMAETEEDLKVMFSFSEIKLTPEGFFSHETGTFEKNKN